MTWRNDRDQRLRYYREYRKNNHEKALAATRLWRLSRLPRNRVAVFDAYGHECACCGSLRQLQVDHIVPWNGGSESPASGTSLYFWLINNDFPLGFQILCRSCNKAKGQGNRCNIVHRAKQPLTLGI